jgi:hypothetical protein
MYGWAYCIGNHLDTAQFGSLNNFIEAGFYIKDSSMEITPHFAGMTHISAAEARRLQARPDSDVFVVSGTSYDAFFKCTNDELGQDADTMQTREAAYRDTLETLDKDGRKTEARIWTAITAINAEYDLAFDTILLAAQRGIEQLVQEGKDGAERNGALSIEQADKLLNQARGNRDTAFHELGLVRRDMVKGIVFEYDKAFGVSELDMSDAATSSRIQAREFRDSQIREFLEAMAAVATT